MRFEKGEPIANYPVRLRRARDVEPELRSALRRARTQAPTRAWTASRSRFNTDLQRPGSDPQAEKWQKLYHAA